jgi:predicted permease
MDTLRQDIRYAFRSLASAPGFTAVALLCLTLGIAANVFVWSPFNAMILRPLPYRDSPRIMHVNAQRLSEERQDYGSWSFPDYEDFAREVVGAGKPFSEVAAYDQRSWNIGAVEEPERLAGARVTASLFPLLGFEPALGRFFLPEEDIGGRVVVLGHGVWQRKFGGDPALVGRSITVNGVPHTVIGVMQEGVRFPETHDVWLPADPQETRTRRGWRNWQVLARLAPGVTQSAAAERTDAFMRELALRYPDTNKGWGAWMQPIQEDLAAHVRPVFTIMAGAVAFVLLIACANVANLLLARGSVRQREVALRAAIGATRVRIVRQLLTESLVLAAIGGVLGVLVGGWGVEAFTRYGVPQFLPWWIRFDVDRTVVVITLGLTAATGVLFGVAPALQLTRPSLSETIKETGGRGAGTNARVGRMRASLVVTQLALSVVLLCGAALMVRSFLETQRADLGFRPERLLTLDMDLAGARYASDSAFDAFFRVAEREAAGTPGVVHAGFAGNMPVKSCCATASYFPEGKEYPVSEGPRTQINVVSPGFFAALGMAVREGRAFDERDTRSSLPVAVVSERLARVEWPGTSAVGRRLRLGAADTTWITVIGVVPDVIVRTLTDRAADPMVYRPFGQMTWRSVTLAVQAAGDPMAVSGAVRARLRALDADLPFSRVEPMALTVHERMFEPRVYGQMFAIFAVAALVLASVGLYGVMAYLVAQRRHEMGVRMALGARARDVVQLVLRGGVRMIVWGVAIGVPAAFGLSQLLRRSLYGVSSTDLVTFVGVPLVLVAVALLATWVPARRASRVSPASALRTE